MKILHGKITKIFKALYIIGLVCFAAYIGSNTFLRNSVKIDENPDLNSGHFGEVPTWTEFADSLEATEIFSEYTEEDFSDDVELAYDLYELSLKRLALSKFYATKLHGVIDFSSVGIEGRSETLQTTAYYKKGTPTLSPYDDYESFYQNIIYLSKEPQMLKLSNLVNQGIREYCDGVTTYEEHGTNPVVDAQFGSATWTGSLKSYPKEQHDTYRQYDQSELREKSNYVINLDTMDEDSVSVKKYVGEDGRTYYDVEFNILFKNSDDPSIKTERVSIERTMGGTLKLECERAMVKMTICENGYMIKWGSESDWISYFGRISGDAFYKCEESISYYNEEEAYFGEWRERCA